MIIESISKVENWFHGISHWKKKNREIVLQVDFSLNKGVNFTEILSGLESEEQNTEISALW